MAVRQRNAFKARERKYAYMSSDEHDGQVTVIGRPNSKVQKDFAKTIKEVRENIAYATDFRDQAGRAGYHTRDFGATGKLRTVNHGMDYWGEEEVGGFKDKLEELGYKVRVNKSGKPTSIKNPKDGSSYRISYGGRDANGKPIRFGNTPIDPTKKSTLSGMGLSVG